MTARRSAPVASLEGRSPDLARVRRVLLSRLRSIGDTVLMTPCISAIKTWRPDVDVDVLLDTFCVPVLRDHPLVARVIPFERTTAGKLDAARELRRRRYDVAIDLNGGTTSALMLLASGARDRVGFSGYRNARLRNVRVTSSADVWGRSDIHTVEHQLALVAGIGVQTGDAGPTTLAVGPDARRRIDARLAEWALADSPYAVIHAEASLPAKTWPAERFARLAARLGDERGLRSVVIGQNAAATRAAAGLSAIAAPGLPLDETMALVASCALFVGNDSGPAHVAAALARPVVVVFGPSNVRLWRPWSQAPWRVVEGGADASGAGEHDVWDAVDAVLGEVRA